MLPFYAGFSEAGGRPGWAVCGLGVGMGVGGPEVLLGWHGPLCRSCVRVEVVLLAAGGVNALLPASRQGRAGRGRRRRRRSSLRKRARPVLLASHLEGQNHCLEMGAA